MLGNGNVLKRLTFGHPSQTAALRAFGVDHGENLTPGNWNRPLVERLTAYAAGVPDDFQDISLDPGSLTEFQVKVVGCCRQIPYGSTLTYGQMAVMVGSPGAARAVGNCMAANRIPLVIPCHRVVPVGGRLGGYSMEGGTALKARLLELEAIGSPTQV